MSRIVLHIDRLVLRGIDPGDAAAVSAGIRAELARLLGAPASAATLARCDDRSRIRAMPVSLPADAGASATGRHIAAGIVRSVGS